MRVACYRTTSIAVDDLSFRTQDYKMRNTADLKGLHQLSPQCILAKWHCYPRHVCIVLLCTSNFQTQEKPHESQLMGYEKLSSSTTLDSLAPAVSALGCISNNALLDSQSPAETLDIFNSLVQYRRHSANLSRRLNGMMTKQRQSRLKKV